MSVCSCAVPSCGCPHLDEQSVGPRPHRPAAGCRRPHGSWPGTRTPVHAQRAHTYAHARSHVLHASEPGRTVGRANSGKAIVGLAAGALRFTHVVRHCMRAGQERATAGQDQRRARKT